MQRRVQRSRQWFSATFGIYKPQYLLPFIDFDLNADVPLYIDPYAITQDRSELAAACQTAIVTYFQALLDVVRNGQSRRLELLLHDRLAEPKQIHLGVAKRARSGVGLGFYQESLIVDALAHSEALKSGAIESIQELELHIEGIGPDKISDLVANIIKCHLADFTTNTCAVYGVPTRACAVNACWNSDRLVWRGAYRNLPLRGQDSYILVPKQFVRCDRDLINHHYFYQHYVLDVLQREMLNADDSLVETLRSGERRITKQSLRRDHRFPPTKTYISQFIREHPDTIAHYRSSLANRFAPADPAFLSGRAQEEDPLIGALLKSLEALPTGAQQATAYEVAILQLLQFAFDWCLRSFTSQYNMDQGRGRIDIVCDNFAGAGLFAQLRDEFSASSIPMECKNYSADLSNDEFNQLSDRLGEKTSRLGFLFCRKISDPQAMSRHVTDRYLRQGNCILLFDDAQLRRIIQLRLQRDFDAIEATLRKMIRDVQYGGRSPQ